MQLEIYIKKTVNMKYIDAETRCLGTEHHWIQIVSVNPCNWINKSIISMISK